MLKPQAPCKDCQDRKIGCHSDCSIYRDFERMNMQQHELIMQQKIKESQSYLAHKEGIDRMKSRKNSKKGWFGIDR